MDASSVVDDRGVERPGEARDDEQRERRARPEGVDAQPAALRGDEGLEGAVQRASFVDSVGPPTARSVVGVHVVHVVHVVDPLGAGGGMMLSATTRRRSDRGHHLFLVRLGEERRAAPRPVGAARRPHEAPRSGERDEAEHHLEREGAGLEEQLGLAQAEVVAEEGDVRRGEPRPERDGVVAARESRRGGGRDGEHELEKRDARGTMMLLLLWRRRRPEHRAGGHGRFVEEPLDDDGEASAEVELGERIVATGADELDGDALAKRGERRGRHEDADRARREAAGDGEDRGELDERVGAAPRGAEVASQFGGLGAVALGADDVRVERVQHRPRRREAPLRRGGLGGGVIRGGVVLGALLEGHLG
mmetsp:Transcript_1805/g.6976  ORF Transcript_1805/g.6976 Transcript_1805/m.6976 type:complete len:363 (-) Transcript_1805:22-1110(-)